MTNFPALLNQSKGWIATGGAKYRLEFMSVAHKLNTLAKLERSCGPDVRQTVLYREMLRQVSEGIGGEDKLELREREMQSEADYDYDYASQAAEDATWD